MKKIMVLLISLILAGILALCCTSCKGCPILSVNSSEDEPSISTTAPSSSTQPVNKTFFNAQEAYAHQLNTIRRTVDTTELKNYWRYFYKDIDGNGITELCITREGCEFTIYTFVSNNLILVGTTDYCTGTLRIFSSDNPNYPGIFAFTCGNSAEHYWYLTIKEGELNNEYIWQDCYLDTPNEREEISFTLDKEIIKESKNLYNRNKDIIRLDFDQEKNDKSFDNAQEAYEHQLNTIRQTVGATQLKEYWSYFYMDIDGNGTKELCIIGEGSELTIYTFAGNNLILVGTADCDIGMRTFSSENPKYPGIFSLTCGESGEHYRYFTIKDAKLYMEYIWHDRYLNGTDVRGASLLCSDEEMIRESKDLRNKNKDIERSHFN